MSCDSAGAGNGTTRQSFPLRYAGTDIQWPIVSMIVGKKADKEPSTQSNPKQMVLATYI